VKESERESVRMCVCVCVYVCERERERKTERERVFFRIDMAQDLFPLTTFHSFLCVPSESVMNTDEMKQTNKKAFAHP
jgi:hypothetical protein